MEPFIGEIIMFGGNFAPRGWALCDGQLLAINQNTALFSLLGTTYGGDGRTTFALPDLRGRVPIHPGNGPGLSSYRLGQKGGAEQAALTNVNQLPAHGHNLASAQIGVGNEAKGSVAADVAAGNFIGNNTGAFRTTGGGGNLSSSVSGTSGNVGGSAGHPNIQPYECVNYIIALTGTFPSRS